jgi:LysM repeat protein
VPGSPGFGAQAPSSRPVGSSTGRFLLELTMSENYFARLSSINVSAHVEKKGGFSYLSWPFAVAQLRLADPGATWEVKRFDGLPYLQTDAGVFVEVAVTVQGVTLSQIHPVLDGKNRPILAPTAFDINTSIQRCLVKAIALHGLGLYIYAGEDLPQIGTEAAANDSTVDTPPPAPATAVQLGKTITPQQQRTIRKLAEEVGVELSRVVGYFGVKDVAEIAVADYLRVVRSLEKRRAA